MESILLIPGMLSTAEVFAPQIPVLWSQGSITVGSTLEGNTVREIAAAILHSAPPRFALVGLSLGGYISLEIMRQAPERVHKLALLSALAEPEEPEQIVRRRSMVSRAQTAFAPFLEQAFSLLLHPSRRNDLELRKIYLRMGRQVGFEAMVRQNEAIISRPDSRAIIKNFSIKTLVVVGDTDPMTSLLSAKAMVSEIPDARLAVVPQCGHGVTIESPDFVNRVLVNWLER